MSGNTCRKVGKKRGEGSKQISYHHGQLELNPAEELLEAAENTTAVLAQQTKNQGLYPPTPISSLLESCFLGIN